MLVCLIFFIYVVNSLYFFKHILKWRFIIFWFRDTIINLYINYFIFARINIFYFFEFFRFSFNSVFFFFSFEPFSCLLNKFFNLDLFPELRFGSFNSLNSFDFWLDLSRLDNWFGWLDNKFSPIDNNFCLLCRR